MADLSWGDLTPAERTVLDAACLGVERPIGLRFDAYGMNTGLLRSVGLLRDEPTSLGRKVWEEQG